MLKNNVGGSRIDGEGETWHDNGNPLALSHARHVDRGTYHHHGHASRSAGQHHSCTLQIQTCTLTTAGAGHACARPQVRGGRASNDHLCSTSSGTHGNLHRVGTAAVWHIRQRSLLPYLRWQQIYKGHHLLPPSRDLEEV